MSDNSLSTPRQRIMAIDALRGFDMFWITGGQDFVKGLVALVWGSVPTWVGYELEHPAWTGFTAWDMIMPTFLFITGAAMPFSLGVEREKGVPLGMIWRRILRRVALLWLLGMIAQGNLIWSVFHWDFSQLHLYSNTLQSIASGYVLASIGILFLSVRMQAVLCAALLALYWFLMMFVPFDGHPAGTLEAQTNFALFIDHALLGHFRDGTAYTWILSSLAFGGTVLFGVFAGHTLKSKLTPEKKLQILIGLAGGCMIGGQLWALHFPIIKHIWTSSMVLWAAGWSYAALALFYWLLDMRHYRRWAFVFIVVGSNAILAYMLGENWVRAVESLVDYLLGRESVVWDGVASGIAFVTMAGFLYVLYRKKIFVRV